MRRIFGAICAVVLLLSGCARAESAASRQIFAMDTVMSLQVWGGDGEKALDQAQAAVYALEQQWSATRAGSVVDRLNRQEALTEQEQAVVERITALSERTGGAFNPRLHSLTELWGFPTQQYYVPTAEEIAQAMEQQDWDFGAAMKGYTGQVLADLMKELGVDRAILNLGGNVQTMGSKPDGAPWQVGIQDPEGDGYLAVVQVEGTTSVVTSGSYQRYFEQDGVVYHHILDPETGAPAKSGLRSVTIICRDGLLADCLSTALFVLGVEKGTELWRNSDDFEAVFLTEDGKILATQGVTLTGCSYETISR